MTWTGFATDLTLNDVLGPNTGAAPSASSFPRAGFGRSPADVYATGDMQPPQPRPRYMRVALGTLAVFLIPVAVLWVAGKADERSKVTAENVPLHPVDRDAANAQRREGQSKSPTGDMTLEHFRKLSAQI